MNALADTIPEAEFERLAMIGARLLAGRPHRTGGTRPRRRPGSGHEFLDYRAWQSGDDARHIDWRASARTRQLQVRRYLDEAGSEWVLCLDASASMAAVDPLKWQFARRLATALAWTLTAVGDRVGLILFSDRIEEAVPPAAGHLQRLRLCSTLAGAVAAGRGSAPRCCAAGLARRPNLVVFSDCLRADAMCADLDALRLRSRACQVLQIVSAADTALPAGPDTVLVDAEDEQRATVSIDAATCEQARRRLAALQARLEAHCRTRDIGYERCETTEDWREVSTRQLHRLARA